MNISVWALAHFKESDETSPSPLIIVELLALFLSLLTFEDVQRMSANHQYSKIMPGAPNRGLTMMEDQSNKSVERQRLMPNLENNEMMDDGNDNYADE